MRTQQIMAPMGEHNHAANPLSHSVAALRIGNSLRFSSHG